MPQLDNNGPLNEGENTGRGIGLCRLLSKQEAELKLGIGMGLRRKSGGGNGRGLRKKSWKYFNEFN